MGIPNIVVQFMAEEVGHDAHLRYSHMTLVCNCAAMNAINFAKSEAGMEMNRVDLIL